MAAQSKKNDRDLSLDILKGAAVLLMIITHTNFLFYADDTEGILGELSIVGARVCFITFLFAFTVVQGIRLVKSPERININSTIARLKLMLPAYYFGALISYLFFNGLEQLSIRSLLEIALFKEQPLLTEFFLAFILFELLVLILKQPLAYLLKQHPTTLLILSLLIYGGAVMVHDLGTTLAEPLYTVKSLLVGNESLHRFGVFTYLPVAIFGFLHGRLIATNQLTYNLILVKLLLLGAGQYLLVISGLDLFGRWPPEPMFLLYGLIFIMIFISASKTRYLDTLLSPLAFWGRSVFFFYFGHLVVIYSLAIALQREKFDAPRALALFLLVLLICTIAYLFKESRFMKGLIEKSPR